MPNEAAPVFDEVYKQYLQLDNAQRFVQDVF